MFEKGKFSILAVFMAFIMFLCPLCGQTAYATAYVPALETGSMISTSEWASNGAALLSEALSKYGAMGVVAAENAAIVVGSAAFAYGATKGITFAVDKSMQTVATLGRYLIANCASASAEIQRTIASVITNVNVDASYYTTKSMVYSAGLLTSLDSFLGNFVDANTIAMNKGLVSQSVIPASALTAMTDSVYALYKNMVHPIYMSRSASDAFSFYPYNIYNVPVSVKYALVNTAGDSVSFWDSAYKQVVMTGIDTQTYWLHYSTLLNPAEWETNWNTASALPWGSTVSYDFTGLEVLQGDTIQDALGLSVDFPLGLDLTGLRDVPLTLTNDLVIPYTDAIAIGTGDIALEDVAEVTTPVEADTGLLGTIGQALSNFLDMLINALKALLEWLFVPSAGFMDSWLEGMMSTVNDRTGILTYPLTCLITFLNRVANISSGDAVLSIPEVKWKGAVLMQKQTFNFNAFLASNPELDTFYGYYLIVVRALLIFSVLRLAWKKYEEMTRS